MIEWTGAIVQGVLLGGLYALFAAGLSLIFGVMRLVNIAHGDLIILAAYLGLSTTVMLGVHPFMALLLVMPVMAGIGYVLQRGVLKHDAGLVADGPDHRRVLAVEGLLEARAIGLGDPVQVVLDRRFDARALLLARRRDGLEQLGLTCAVLARARRRAGDRGGGKQRDPEQVRERIERAHLRIVQLLAPRCNGEAGAPALDGQVVTSCSRGAPGDSI